jgi:RNA polymerase sigma factor (sigma-70 family)
MSSHARTLLAHLRRLVSPADSDAVLLARWLERRDEDAFAEMLARHGPMVFGLCRRVLGDVHAAEDVFQATFLVLARKAAKVRRPEALPSFLYGVALRLARKARAAICRRAMQLPADTLEPIDPHPHPLDELSGRELLALLDEEVARLPEAYRLPLLLCVMQGRSIEEAARLLGWSIGSLRGRLTRGRERLRQHLTRRGLDLSAGVIALLAPAAVSDQLRAACLRNLTASAAPAVSDLAASWTAALKLKAIGLGLFVAVAAGLGATLPLIRAPQPETPAAPSPAAPPAQAKDEPRRDRYGDPLPSGAVARLGTLRFRAPGEIETLALAPDSKTLAVSSRGGLFLFDAVSGQRLRHLLSQGPAWRPETLLVFSPDGKRLAGRGDKTVGQYTYSQAVIRVWELDGERLAREYDVGQSIIWVGWSAKNEPLAIRIEKGVLYLHDLAAGRSRRFECKEPQKFPSGFLSDNPPIACSPAGKALAVVDNKNVIHVWDTASGRERCTLRPKGDGMHSLTFSPDGGRLLSITPQAVQMWDVAMAKALFTVDATMHYGPIFTADGKTLAILASWQTIRFWDTTTGRERGRTEGKGDYASIALSPDGKWLAAADRHGSAFHIWDVATGKRKPEPVGHRSRPRGIFSPAGQRVATSGGLDGTLRVWNAATGDSLVEVHRPGWARDVAFSLDGRTLFSTGTDENVWLSDAATGERRHVIKLEDPERPDTYQSAIHSFLSDDGKTFVAFSYYYAKNQAGPRYQDTLITGFDAFTHDQLFQRRRPGMDSWLALSADARVLAVPHHDPSTRLREMTPGKGPMRLEDVATGEPLLTFPALPGQTWPLAFSSDGRLLASNNFQRAEPGKDGKPGKATYTLRLREILTAAEALSLPAADFNRVAFSHDNRLMAVAAPKQEIVVWDLRHGRERRRFKGFNAEVVDLAFSPDGRRLISGLADSTLLIWDVGARDTAPAGKLGAEGLAKAWADLAGADAPRAFRARGALAVAPEETVPFLQEHLHPARPADAERLRDLLAELESEQFAVREKAQKTLEELGNLAEPALRQTLTNKPTLEVRRRVQALLENLRGPVTKPEMLRSLRAVAVLEDIGSTPARRLLEELAKGTPEARQTREAKESLHRLVRRTSATR